MSQKDPGHSSAYTLSRDFYSSVRLFLQHFLWRRQLGFLLSPRIPLSELKRDLKIVDIACGTGQWLVDLSRDLPEAQLEGYDISNTQFVPAEWLPTNVKLSTLDALGEIPGHMREKYDVVHVGLVVVVLQGDPQTFMNNLDLLLKPGGYIQWDEADLEGLFLGNANESVKNKNLAHLYERMDDRFKPSGVNYSWTRRLDETFTRNNYSVLENKYFPISDDIAYPWSHMQLCSVAELIRGLDPTSDNIDEWWELFNGATQEVVRGAGVRMGMVVASAQKPVRRNGS